MAISSAGIGSGLDVAKIVEQTVAAEKIPLKKLEYKAEGIQTQISTYGEIKSLTSKLGDIVSKLTRDSAWNGVTISSSNSTITGTMTGIAAPGTYNIKVTQLAQAQTTVIGGAGGAALPKDKPMGAAGTIKLTMGAESKDIAIESSDTLTKIATKINEAGMGIQASIVTDVDGKERLMLRSKETGTDKAFTVSSALAALGQKTTQDAQNAKVELNGLVFGQGNTASAASATKHRGLGLGQVRDLDVVGAGGRNPGHGAREGGVAGADAHAIPSTVAGEFGDDVAQFGGERFDFAVGRNLGLDAFGFVLKFLQRDFFRRNHLLDDFGDI